VALGHRFFQEPVNPFYLWTPDSASDTGRYPSWFLLPTPHPVVGEGLFTLDIWGPAAALYWVLLGVAEVSDCNV